MGYEELEREFREELALGSSLLEELKRHGHQPTRTSGSIAERLRDVLLRAKQTLSEMETLTHLSLSNRTQFATSLRSHQESFVLLQRNSSSVLSAFPPSSSFVSASSPFSSGSGRTGGEGDTVLTIGTGASFRDGDEDGERDEEDEMRTIDQRQKLLSVSEQIGGQRDRLDRIGQIGLESEEIGNQTLDVLYGDRVKLNRILDKTDDVIDNARLGKSLLNRMTWQVYQKKIVLIVVIVLEILAMALIIWLKLR